MRRYMTKSKRQTDLRLEQISLDAGGKHKCEIRSVLQNLGGIKLEYTPAYDS